MNARQPTIRPLTRDAIFSAALEVLGVNAGASLSEIAIRAGVGRATLHRHFRNRDDLIAAIGAQALAETEAAVRAVDSPGAPAVDRLRAMFEAVIPLGGHYHFLGMQPVADELLKAGYRSQLDWLRALVDALRSEGEVALDIPSSWAVAQIDQMIWLAWREVSAGRLAQADAADLAVRTIVTGLSPQ